MKLEALRLLGAMLKATPRNTGARLAGTVLGGSKKELPRDTTPTLADLGLDKKTSMLARRVASSMLAPPCAFLSPLLQYASLRGPYALLDSPIPSLPGPLTMRGVKYNGDEKLTLLELVLRLEGEFRRSLELIHVTPLQAGVLLFLSRNAEAKLTDAATALGVKPPTLSQVVQALVRKRWVIRRYSVEDRRAVCLSLSRQGEALAQRIKKQVRGVSTQIKYKIVAKQK